jgi:hypothetical protein
MNEAVAFALALTVATCQMPLRSAEARPWQPLQCGSDVVILSRDGSSVYPNQKLQELYSPGKPWPRKALRPSAIKITANGEYYYRGKKCIKDDDIPDMPGPNDKAAWCPQPIWNMYGMGVWADGCQLGEGLPHTAE